MTVPAAAGYFAFSLKVSLDVSTRPLQAPGPPPHIADAAGEAARGAHLCVRCVCDRLHRLGWAATTFLRFAPAFVLNTVGLSFPSTTLHRQKQHTHAQAPAPEDQGTTAANAQNQAGKGAFINQSSTTRKGE